MICPKKVQDICIFGMDCPLEAVVDDNSECADYIRKTLAALEGMQRDQADPVEAAEVQQERDAIQGEIVPLWNEAPLPCRILHRLCGSSPSAVMWGCKLGRRAVFSRADCKKCPEYAGWRFDEWP